MKNQHDIRIISWAMLGFAHWLFGNLYETVVFSPNFLLSDKKLPILENVRDLFSISPPYFYYLPWSAVSILLVIVLFFRLRVTTNKLLDRWKNYALLGAITSGILTYFIITIFNVNLWIGDKEMSEGELNVMIWRNFWAGITRLLTVGFTFYSLYRCLRLCIAGFYAKQCSPSSFQRSA